MAVMILENEALDSHFANFLPKMTACLGDIDEFSAKITQIAREIGLNLADYEIDHLAVRVNSAEKAQAWRALLLSSGKLLKESEVNGRPIALISLPKPLSFCGSKVSLLELPFPKGKNYPVEGWEHIEVVVPLLKNESIEQWLARMQETFNLRENQSIALKISQPQANGESLPNPTIAVTLRHAPDNHCCLKIHPFALAQVIESE